MKTTDLALTATRVALTTAMVFLTLVAYGVDTTYYSVFMGSRPAGVHKAWVEYDGTYGYYYSYNDRGRGPELTERVRIGTGGNILSVKINGHDYTKNAVEETFQVAEGYPEWINAAEMGKSEFKFAGELYYPVNGTPGGKSHLIERLDADDDGKVNLLPRGALVLTQKETVRISDLELTIYGIGGISYEPSFYWLDKDMRLFAVVSPARGISCILKGYEHLKDEMVAKQVELENALYKDIARKATTVPRGPVAIVDVDMFDARSGEIQGNTTVIFENGKITEVTSGPTSIPDDAMVIDGSGKTLCPGFFDMHVHVDKSDGILHVAGGVTAVRDMAVQSNFIKDKQELKDNFESNVMIGPRIVGMCGFIDGNGPFTRDRGIDNVEQGLEEIEKFNEGGLKQIKLYSSIKPQWVKPLADRAHEYGMRVSGHIPAFMTATEAIQDGYDEIQHTNMLFLNFYGDTLDTRNMTRFSAVGEKGYAFDFDSPAFTEFVQLLRARDIVVDPTLAVFEWGYRSVTGQPSPTYAKVVDRLPISGQRRYYGGGFMRPPGLHQTYLRSYDRMLDMVRVLHERGVRIVPGTDNLAGFAYHRELELYVESGISAQEVLQLATLRSAEVAGLDNELGSIERGKYADLVLLEGNPLEDISDVRNVVLTVKNGLLFYPGRLYPSVGVKPATTTY